MDDRTFIINSLVQATEEGHIRWRRSRNGRPCAYTNIGGIPVKIAGGTPDFPVRPGVWILDEYENRIELQEGPYIPDEERSKVEEDLHRKVMEIADYPSPEGIIRRTLQAALIELTTDGSVSVNIEGEIFEW